MRDIEFITEDTWTWSNICQCDAMMFHRPFMPSHVGLAELSKKMGLKICCDYDDLLNDIPIGNPAYQVFMRKETWENVQKMLGLAEVVTVSTDYLGEKLGQGKAVTIHNALPPYITPSRPHHQNNLIIWRGSPTHVRDIGNGFQIIANFLKAHTDWNIVIMGDPPPQASVLPAKQRQLLPWMSPPDYLATLKQMAPKVLVSFLEDSPFNRAKSNISYLESVSCGAAFIGSRLPEFDKPGAFLFDSDQEFEKQLNTAALGDTLSQWRAARAYVQDNQTMELMNQKRREVLNRLLPANGFITRHPVLEHVRD
jgi:hypothetical protein